MPCGPARRSSPAASVVVDVARQRLISGTSEHYGIRNGKVSGNFLYKTVDRMTPKSVAYDLEPEKIELVDQPERDADALRVCGPFEVMSLGRYSVEDWKGYVVSEGDTLFDRKRRGTDYKSDESGYISAWYLDEDYEGDCLVDCQMLFDFKKAPNLKAALRVEVDPQEYKLQVSPRPSRSAATSASP